MTDTTSGQKLKIGLMLDISEGSLNGQTPTFRDLLTVSQVAEQVGLDSLWLADHLVYRFPPEPESAPWEALTLLSSLAAVTSRITLGPLVACTSFRPPALLAKMADTLDEISAGRFILGLGAGWHKPEYDAFGYPFDHLASRFDEALQIIVPLLREGHVDFQGSYYQVQNCVLRPRGPSHAGPPILIGASKPRMLKLVARYADAWNTAWHTDPAVVRERIANLHNACAEVGRDPATIDLTVGTAVRLGPPTDAASEKAFSGTLEEIAQQLRDFADAGAPHLIVALDSVTPTNVEQLGQIAELVRSLPTSNASSS